MHLLREREHRRRELVSALALLDELKFLLLLLSHLVSVGRDAGQFGRSPTRAAGLGTARGSSETCSGAPRCGAPPLSTPPTAKDGHEDPLGVAELHALK